ncbi:MHYT domain-containing protein [Streptomyces sp. NRRL F-5135]|uniref:MHYT domain-containing protein n=1 Tax=Streptomyces sp. NRRL F-5135 TaxID=1463858 RepID=UPI0007C4F2E8|nr:MHYT domain-containing protein [Streptomyces sp. NRRL F-5135]
MQGTVDGFSYGLVTPVAAFLMACLGGALGLRCTARALRVRRSWKPGALALGAASIGSGVWTMHFIAMMGFSVSEVPIGYDRLTTVASLVVAIVMVGIGIFIVGYRRTTTMALITGGTITGLGIATSHYLGMAGIRLHGRISYDTVTVVFSVVIAVAAAITALWTVASRRGLLTSVGASLVMGVAVTGMHYTGMAGVTVHLTDDLSAAGGVPAAELLAPMLVGPTLFLLLAGLAVFVDPALVAGDRGHRQARNPAAETCGRTGVPAQRIRPRSSPRVTDAAGARSRDHGDVAGRAAVRASHQGRTDLHDH